jgi:hypothetical protein
VAARGNRILIGQPGCASLAIALVPKIAGEMQCSCMPGGTHRHTRSHDAELARHTATPPEKLKGRVSWGEDDQTGIGSAT